MVTLAEYWYNTSHHSAIAMSPFEALYGHPPRHFGITVAGACSMDSLNQWLQEHRLASDVIKQHLTRASQRMKQQVDKGRSEHQFAMGDLVFLRLQHYVQSSLAPRANQKLAFKFFVPYAVLEKIGKVAYKLDLPATSSVHSVFHVSQMKKAVGSNVQVTDSLPSELTEFQVPEKILQWRLINRGIKFVIQVLVKWSSLLVFLATWEDMEALRQRFPGALAWGQAGSSRGEDVRHRVPVAGNEDTGVEG
jgi:hypothetical protein